MAAIYITNVDVLFRWWTIRSDAVIAQSQLAIHQIPTNYLPKRVDALRYAKTPPSSSQHFMHKHGLAKFISKLSQMDYFQDISSQIPHPLLCC
ncbi:hypothetical protein NW764_013225 [Fusarium oxysporum]|nr:hypothetical protein NW764_013225 [Fusarium oxysporum]